VLTMTGTSPDIENPRYSYDTLGTNCLDTLQDCPGPPGAVKRSSAVSLVNRVWGFCMGARGA
jgi:hypothetical protein